MKWRTSCHVDSLSRVVNGIEQNTFEQVLALEQERDINIVKIREALEKEPNSFQSFQLVDGLRCTKKCYYLYYIILRSKYYGFKRHPSKP